MNTPTVTMKGAVIAAYAQGNSVVIWMSSPTGDSSDSFQYSLPCVNDTQAEVIAQMWKNTWGLNA
jgi:hypothetical protein